MKPSVLFILFCIVLSGCSKDDETTYPGPLLRGKSLVKTSELLVYSDGKRVTDQDKIASFLSEDPAWAEIDEWLDLQNVTIQFIRADSAVLSGETGVSVEYYNGRMILKEQLRSVIGSLSSEFPVVKQILKYRSESGNLPLPGGFVSHLYYPLYVGYGSPNHFRFFVINYKISCNREFSFSKQTEIAFNEFNPDAIEMLTEQDTLAVQTFELVFSQ